MIIATCITQYNDQIKLRGRFAGFSNKSLLTSNGCGLQKCQL